MAKEDKKQKPRNENPLNREPYTTDDEFPNGNIPADDTPFFKKYIDILLGRPYRIFEEFIDNFKEWRENTKASFAEKNNKKESKENEVESKQIDSEDYIYGLSALEEQAEREKKQRNNENEPQQGKSTNITNAINKISKKASKFLQPKKKNSAKEASEFVTKNESMEQRPVAQKKTLMKKR